MIIPKGWLSYSAPEVLRALNVQKQVGLVVIFDALKNLKGSCVINSDAVVNCVISSEGGL